MANLDEWATVIGEAFKITRPDADDKTNFTVKSYVTGKYINCTLWDNSHGHVELANGDCVVVNGKLKRTPKKDGDGHWINLNVSKIGRIPLDAGVRDDEPTQGKSDDEPDVL